MPSYCCCKTFHSSFPPSFETPFSIGMALCVILTARWFRAHQIHTDWCDRILFSPIPNITIVHLCVFVCLAVYARACMHVRVGCISRIIKTKPPFVGIQTIQLKIWIYIEQMAIQFPMCCCLWHDCERNCGRRQHMDKVCILHIVWLLKCLKLSFLSLIDGLKGQMQFQIIELSHT